MHYGMTFKSFKMFPISQSVNSPQAHPSRSHSWKTSPPVMGTSLSLGTTRDCINTTEMFGKKKIKFRFVFLSWGFSYCPDVTHTAARGGRVQQLHEEAPQSSSSFWDRETATNHSKISETSWFPKVPDRPLSTSCEARSRNKGPERKNNNTILVS